jgi:inorganic phosphate transporter, PiT family
LDADLTVALVVATALAFDFTNGFHDTASVVATSISTRAMGPEIAVAYSALMNFAGAFLSLEVASTVANDLVAVRVESDFLLVVFGGLVGAITWNLVTWYMRVPSSSSHALIGGLVGAAFAAAGAEAVHGEGTLGNVVVPALVAPLLAFLVASLSSTVVLQISGRLRPARVARGFRVGQALSGGLLALGHGTNDAQKTMGVIALALVANGTIAADDFEIPDWVVVSAATAIALGTYAGGRRFIRAMSARTHKMEPVQGFAAQGAASTVILACSHAGFPLSTTHTISGAVVGSGSARRRSPKRWGVPGSTVAAWVVTLPAAAALGALAYGVARLFGTGVAGPLVVLALYAAGVLVLIARVRRP